MQIVITHTPSPQLTIAKGKNSNISAPPVGTFPVLLGSSSLIHSVVIRINGSIITASDTMPVMQVAINNF